MSIEEFKIEIPEEEISNLRTKISLTRWPDELNTNKWALGTKLDFLQKLAKYWAKDFDWRKHEKQLNQIALGGVGKTCLISKLLLLKTTPRSPRYKTGLYKK